MAFYKGWSDAYVSTQPLAGPQPGLKASPLSQIPGIGDYGSPASKDEPKRQWIKDSDTEYVRLAKQGGHADLLSGKSFLDMESISREVKRSMPNNGTAVTAPYATSSAAAAANTAAAGQHVSFAAGDASNQSQALGSFRPQSAASTTSMGQYEYEIPDGVPLPEEYFHRQSLQDHGSDQQMPGYGSLHSGPPRGGYTDHVDSRTILSAEDYDRMRSGQYRAGNEYLGRNDNDATLHRELTSDSSRNIPTEQQQQQQQQQQQMQQQRQQLQQQQQRQQQQTAGIPTDNSTTGRERPWHQQAVSTTTNGKVDSAGPVSQPYNNQNNSQDVNECQQNKKKQTDGSEISRLLAFDYVKSRSTPRSRAAKPPVQPNRAGGGKQPNPNPAGVNGHSNPITSELSIQGVTSGRSKPSAGGGNGQTNPGAGNGYPSREGVSGQNGGTSRRTPRGAKNVNKTSDQGLQSTGRGVVERGARSSSVTRKGSAASSSSSSTYMTEYQEKMSTDGASSRGSAAANSLAKSRSLQNIAEMSHGSRKLADNRPDFLKITSAAAADPPPQLERPQQYGRRKPSVELRPDFLLGSHPPSDNTTTESGRIDDGYARQEATMTRRPEFRNYDNSPLTEAASILHQRPLEDQGYGETNQRYNMTDESHQQQQQQQQQRQEDQQLIDQQQQHEQSFRRRKADVDFRTPVGSAVFRRK